VRRTVHHSSAVGAKDRNAVELSNPKQKDTPEQAPMLLALPPIGGSAILSHEAVGIAGFTTESEHHVLTVLRDSFGNRGATNNERRDAVARPKSTWYRSINGEPHHHCHAIWGVGPEGERAESSPSDTEDDIGCNCQLCCPRATTPPPVPRSFATWHAKVGHHMFISLEKAFRWWSAETTRDRTKGLMTQITYADRRRLLDLVQAYADAGQRAAYADEGSAAFGTREECRAAVEAACGELAELVWSWPLVVEPSTA